MLHNRIVRRIVSRYDRPVLNNVHRGEYVECMIAELLGPDWTLPWQEGYDWAPWDLRHASGATIEVKQSAAFQTWHAERGERTKSPRFDIAPRMGYWTADGTWIDGTGRPASIYVFAWHPNEAETVADHRSPGQWMFYVVRAAQLPPEQRSIGLAGLQRLAGAVGFKSLAPAVRDAVDDCQGIGS